MSLCTICDDRLDSLDLPVTEHVWLVGFSVFGGTLPTETADYARKVGVSGEDLCLGDYCSYL